MLEWSSLVPGPEAKSSSSESGNLTLFTKSYQFCPIRITQDVAFSDRLLALGNVNLGSLQVFPWLDCSLLFHFSSVQSLSRLNSLPPRGLQDARLPYQSPTPRVYSNSCPSSQWCHPAISSSVIPFSSCPQSLPVSGSFPMSQLFPWGGQRIGVSASASVLPMNTQDWSPSGWTGWISLQSKGLSRVFSNATVQKHQFFGAQPSL